MNQLFTEKDKKFYECEATLLLERQQTVLDQNEEYCFFNFI